MAFALMLLQSKRTMDECPILVDGVAFADRRAQLAVLTPRAPSESTPRLKLGIYAETQYALVTP
jgi:CO dehydrogenase/acetyl-CoA synthase gamma subunit (corrinoid Fe-S protein)